jgi:prepilin-type processing-associated H-X9-DG protein
MPIEIRELHIKTTVSTQDGGDDLFLFGGLTTGGEDAAPEDDAPIGGFALPAGDLALDDGSAAQRHHTGTGNFLFADGSVKFALEPLDLLG